MLQTDSVVDLDGKYSHEVELVSVSKLLADTTSSGLTVTQLSSDLAFYYRSYSYYNGHFSSGTKTQVPFSLLENSSDTSEIDVRTMKKEKRIHNQLQSGFLHNRNCPQRATDGIKTSLINSRSWRGGSLPRRSGNKTPSFNS